MVVSGQEALWFDNIELHGHIQPCLFVVDDGDREVIPNSMRLVARRTAQEYNQKKIRRGAYWEDRYRATAVKSGEHLARGLVYIDTSMVRAGVISHPSMWPFSGYNEIQKPRRKNVLIDYGRLQGLLGASTNDQLRTSHKVFELKSVRVVDVDNSCHCCYYVQHERQINAQRTPHPL